MFAVAYYVLFFIAALIPTSVYCRRRERWDNKND